jgi:benzoyl-CoA reductase/2-hydroxyglutaryl-CoA dehydratase subunit BcrC/BadD/HgdB
LIDFDRILGDPINAHLQRAIDGGAIPIGVTCSSIPEVMLSVGNLVPVRVRAPGIAGTELADSYLSCVTCSFVRSLLEYAMDGRYGFLRGWVFAGSCDHLRRLHDNIDYLVKPGFSYILDVPHIKGPAGVAWLSAELGRFGKALEAEFGLVIDDASLSKAIEGFNDRMALLKSVGDFRKMPNPPLTGGDFHRLMTASSVVPGDAAAELARGMLSDLGGKEGKGGHRARLMVLGGQIDDPSYIDLIESQGGLVVADRFCTGSIPALMPIDTGKPPLEATAEHTLARTDCPRMMGDFEGRLKRTLAAVVEYGVDGVIVEATKFCDIWGVEASGMVKALRVAGVPVLRLEHEYRLGAEGQMRTRVQAFLESMGR